LFWATAFLTPFFEVFDMLLLVSIVKYRSTVIKLLMLGLVTFTLSALTNVIAEARQCGLSSSSPQVDGVAQKMNLTTYVANLFDEIQCDWESRVFSKEPVLETTRLKLQVSPTGEMTGESVLPSGGTLPSAFLQQFIKRQRPENWVLPGAGKSPQSLELLVNMRPDQMTLQGYKLVETDSAEPLVSYSPNITPQASEPVSLLYVRAFPPGKAPGAVATGKGTSPVLSETEMTDYVETVRKQVLSNWRLELEEPFQTVVANMMIDRDGRLLGVNMVSSSGNRMIDKAVLNAISTAGPFPTVPRSVESLPVSIHYVFEPSTSTSSATDSAE
jgi:TonB family protein